MWGRAVHRVAADGISPEQAVDEAIAREAAPERVAGRARRSLARLAIITGLRRQVRPLLALLPSRPSHLIALKTANSGNVPRTIRAVDCCH